MDVIRSLVSVGAETRDLAGAVRICMRLILLSEALMHYIDNNEG